MPTSTMFLSPATTILLVDTTLRNENGPYWWDGKDLHRYGEDRDAPNFGDVVARVSSVFPQCTVSGVVVFHHPSGKLNEPTIELAPRAIQPSGHWVPIVNPAGFISTANRFFDNAPGQDQIHAALLARLLQMQK